MEIVSNIDTGELDSEGMSIYKTTILARYNTNNELTVDVSAEGKEEVLFELMP